MLDGLYDFFVAVRDARFGFPELSQSVAELCSSISQNPDIRFLWDAAVGFLNPVSFVVPYLLITFFGFTAFFGKKMLPVLKFITLLLVGFVLGAHLIPPLLAETVYIPAWICGLTVGLLAAILNRFIYVTVYAIGGFYCSYILCYNAFFINKAVVEHSLDKALVSFAVAAAVVTVAFFLQKYVEMVGTAALSGYLIAITVQELIFNYSAPEALGAYGWLITLTAVLAVAIPGAYVQIKKRVRY